MPEVTCSSLNDTPLVPVTEMLCLLVRDSTVSYQPGELVELDAVAVTEVHCVHWIESCGTHVFLS